MYLQEFGALKSCPWGIGIQKKLKLFRVRFRNGLKLPFFKDKNFAKSFAGIKSFLFLQRSFRRATVQLKILLVAQLVRAVPMSIGINP